MKITENEKITIEQAANLNDEYELMSDCDMQISMAEKATAAASSIKSAEWDLSNLEMRNADTVKIEETKKRIQKNTKIWNRLSKKCANELVADYNSLV